MYTYKTLRDDISIGDTVLVDRIGEKTTGKVVKIETRTKYSYLLKESKDIIDVKKNFIKEA